MAAKLEAVIQSALKTFTKYIKKGPEFTQTDIHQLKTLIDDIASDDVRKHGSTLSIELTEFSRNKRPSLDYLPVYEDDCISVGVFLLREGAKLPIHDHPNMYGIIKVLEGVIKVTSYSFIQFDRTLVNKDKNLFYHNPLKVMKHPEILIRKEDESCLLTPTDKNIHEVECVTGPAAFLDILSPPYDDGDANEPRACHYFEEIKANDDVLRGKSGIVTYSRKGSPLS